MVETVSQVIDAGIIASNIIGGGVALLVAVGVSRLEARRQARQKRNNWYRAVHNTCVRAKGGKNINQMGLSDSKMKEYAHLYRAYGEQLQNLLAEAPTDEVDLPLFNALQNIELCCIRYGNEVETPNPHKAFLQSRHETMMDFCLISLYTIENKKSQDVEFLEELDGEELEEAKSLYEKFENGSLYEDQNEQIGEFMKYIDAVE